MASKLQVRRDTAANWILYNPILADGEMGIETDTKKHKIGDGVTTWDTLKYWAYSRDEIDQIILNLEMVQPLPAGDIAPLLYKPTITYPLEGASDYIGTITGSTYQTISTYNGEHNYSEWQIAYNALFTDMIGSYQGDVSLESWNPSSVPPLTTVHVRVRYGSDGHLSDWSDTLSFTTPEFNLEAPVITAPSDSSTDVIAVPILSFQTTNAIDGHISSTYQIATDTGFTNIVYEATSETDLFSHTVESALSQGVIYYLRVMYTTLAYGGSAWSTPTHFTTAAFTEMVYFSEFYSGVHEYLRKIIIDNEGNYHTLCQIPKSATTSTGYAAYLLAKMNNKFDLFSTPYTHRKTIWRTASSTDAQEINDMIIDSDGNYVIVGCIVVITGYPITLMKVGQNFNLIASTSINHVSTTAHSIRVRKIIEDSDGNYVIVGYNITNKSIFIQKFAKDLTYINNRMIIRTNADPTTDLIEDRDGNYVVVGSRLGGGYGYFEGNILKYDKNLNLLANSIFSISTNHDAFEGIAVDNNNNYIVIGSTGSSSSAANPRQPWIIKMDSNFNIITSKVIGTLGTDNYFNKIALTNAGDIIAAGNYGSAGTGSSEFLVAKFDANINLLDTLLVGGTNYESTATLAIDKDNNIVVGGYSRSAKTNTTYYGMFAANIKGDFSVLDGTVTETLGYQITKPALVATTSSAVLVAPIAESSVFQEGATSTFTFETPYLTITEKTALY